MKGHSKTNGHQMQALKREVESLRQRLDRTVALADKELGVRGQGTPIGARLIPEAPNPGLVSTAAAVQPAPAPVPGSIDLNVARGELSKTFGVSGTPIVSGFLRDMGEYNADLLGRAAIPIYEQMRRGDGQVRATLAACKMPVLSAKWEVAPREEPGVSSQESGEDSANPEPRTPNSVSSTGAGKNTANKAKEVAQFVKSNLFGGLEFRNSSGGWTTQNWDDVLRNALLMLDFGCAVHEEVWTVDGDHIRLRKLASRMPITFYRWHTEQDGETLLALEQYGYRGGRFLNVLLPADKMALFVYCLEGANFYGIALQRPMYPHWYVKNQLYRIDAIACERNALGIPVWKLPPGFSKEDRDAAFNFVTQLAAHEATGAVEPPGEAHTGFRLVGYQGNLRDSLPSIEHHNVMISRAALALFMDLATSSHGSRALGEQHGDFFMLSLQNLADQIARTLTNTTIRRLVEFNFGENAPVPRLLAANVQSRGLSDIVEALTKFAQAGLVVSEENLRKFIREELALPQESPRDVVAIRGETVAEGGKTGDASGASGGKV